MRAGVKFNKTQLRDYSSLFSRSAALSWLKNDFSSIDYKINRYDYKWYNLDKVTYLDYLKYVYSILELNYQNEYIFKNSFLNEWLIKEVGEQSSKIFSEFRIEKSVADLAMFNGNSKAFEIKTEYDSDSRLSLQIENYRKIFNQTFLIVPESKLSIYEKYDDNIGIIVLSSNDKQRFSLYRNAVIDLKVDASAVMNVLHSGEYKSIVNQFYGDLPKMTSFSQFKICSDLIKQIPNYELNKLFIEQIKSRGSNNNLSTSYYKEFNQLCLALKMSKSERNQMIGILKTSLQA